MIFLKFTNDSRARSGREVVIKFTQTSQPLTTLRPALAGSDGCLTVTGEVEKNWGLVVKLGFYGILLGFYGT